MGTGGRLCQSAGCLRSKRISSLTINKNYALNGIDFYGKFPIIESTTECLNFVSKIQGMATKPTTGH